MIDRRLRGAVRPLRRLMRAGTDLADSRAIAAIAMQITGSIGAWTVGSVRRARSGTRIVTLRDARGPAAILKLTDVVPAAGQLDREADLLGQLRRLITDDHMIELIPEPIATGRSGEWTYLLERALPGVSSTPSLRDPERRRWVIGEATSLAARLHELTSVHGPMTPERMSEWIDEPLGLVTRLATGSPATEPTIEAIRGELHAALGEDAVTVAFIHGDFWSENLLVDVDARRITGLVDWDSAAPGALPAHDLLHFVLYSRKLLRGSEIGAEICRALGPDPGWQPEEQPAIDRVTASRDAGVLRAPVLLYWLRIVSENFARQPDATRRRKWVSDNIDAVLACV
jgi:aminoglycoside phosphotransferase